MKKQAYQKPTLYDSSGNKIQEGAFDVFKDVLLNATHDGSLDYIVNNLEALHSADSTLQSNIDAEASARESADKTLQARTAIHLAYVDGDLALVEE